VHQSQPQLRIVASFADPFPRCFRRAAVAPDAPTVFQLAGRCQPSRDDEPHCTVGSTQRRYEGVRRRRRCPGRRAGARGMADRANSHPKSATAPCRCRRDFNARGVVYVCPSDSSSISASSMASPRARNPPAGSRRRLARTPIPETRAAPGSESGRCTLRSASAYELQSTG